MPDEPMPLPGDEERGGPLPAEDEPRLESPLTPESVVAHEPPPAAEPEPVPRHVAPASPVPPGPAVPVRPLRRLGALWWGTALILVGAALLISQFVPSVQLWRYWPLIIVALGIRQIFGPARERWSIRHLGEGLSTIAIGLVFLGQMVGYLAWDVWLNIFRLWPLLLVALGLEVIGKGLRSEFVRFLGSAVIVAGLAYGALVMTSTAGSVFPFVQVAESEAFSLGTNHSATIRRGTVRVDGGVGRLAVTDGEKLVFAEGASPFEPRFDVTTNGDETDIRVGLGEGAWIPGMEARLEVELDRKVVWDLDVNAGVSTYELDLRNLELSRLKLNAGVSSGTVTLGEPVGDVRVPVDVNSGVSSLTIRVPEGSAAQVTVKTGLSGVDADGDWDSERDDNRRIYRSARFSDNRAYWDIAIDAGVSGVNIEYY